MMKFYKRSEVHIPFSFMLISIMWIVFSDKFFLGLEKNITSFQITQIQTIKGTVFVIAVTALIHFMIRSSNKKLVQSEGEYNDLYQNMPFLKMLNKQKEDELQKKQNEQNLLALINNTADLMWSVDCNFKYFIFNEPYLKYYKMLFLEDVYVGKCALNAKQGAAHMQKWKSLYERALKGEKLSVDMDFVVNNDFYFTTIRLNPIYDANKNIIGASCFLQDITEKKLHLRKIEQQNEQLKQIAFITSHQVRVPLANILGLTEILDKDNPVNPANYKIIEYIKTSAKQLDETIKDMVQQTAQADG